MLSKKLESNIESIKEILIDCEDIVYRDFKVGANGEYSLALIYTDGLIDKKLISEFTLLPLMIGVREAEPTPLSVKKNILEFIVKKSIAITEIEECDTIDDSIDAILTGETVLLFDGYDKAVILSSRGWPVRGIESSESETAYRGPRDAFTETLKFNTSLIRRRIRDPNLKVKMYQIGRRSKTDVAVMYIGDIANDMFLKELNSRLENINVDAIVESSILEEFIQDNIYSPFPQIENTERPDAVAASLYEGRIAIVVDNTPSVLIIPATVGTLMQSTEDYYSRWPIAILIRFIRYIAAFVAVSAPALYVSVTSFDPGILPTRLAFYVSGTRINVPFPAVIEALLMEVTIEFLREAGSRISGPIGTTIGIVGGLIIGQAAVEAGIVSPLMIIIVAVTAIATFTLPSYEFSSALRLYRFGLIIFAAFLGLYGVMLGLILMITHMVKLNSFGIPFTSPFSGLGLMGGDLKDTLIRIPMNKLKYRPKFTFPQNRKRMK